MTHDWWNNDEFQKQWVEKFKRSAVFDWLVQGLVFLFFAAVVTVVIIAIGIFVEAR